jgi:hypothetical protein
VGVILAAAIPVAGAIEGAAIPTSVAIQTGVAAIPMQVVAAEDKTKPDDLTKQVGDAGTPAPTPQTASETVAAADAVTRIHREMPKASRTTVR